jgi:hypothetical protein
MGRIADRSFSTVGTIDALDHACTRRHASSPGTTCNCRHVDMPGVWRPVVAFERARRNPGELALISAPTRPEGVASVVGKSALRSRTWCERFYR